MRLISKIIIHCSDTPESTYFDIEDIRKWHIQERGWSDVGYHYVVLLDGEIQKGREDNKIGAHCYGHNSTSIGVCYIGGGDGKDTRTIEQKNSLIGLVKGLKEQYPDAVVFGHSDFSDKECPCFNAREEYKDL